jgi:hypothetical protein
MEVELQDYLTQQAAYHKGISDAYLSVLKFLAEQNKTPPTELDKKQE